jgi:Ca-activated chloride channel homolog
MTERDLSKLKDLPTPAPSDDAKRRAVAAALAAFDAAVETTGDTQGVGAASRPTDVSSSNKERQGMRYNRKVFLSLAASVAAVLLAVPLVMHTLDGGRPELMSGIGAPVETSQVSGGLKVEPQFSSPVPNAAPMTDQGVRQVPTVTVLPGQSPVGAGQDVATAPPVAVKPNDELARLIEKKQDELPGLSVDERAAELDASSVRKGSRKGEQVIITPDGQSLTVTPGGRIEPRPMAPAAPAAAPPFAPAKPATVVGRLQEQALNGYATSNDNARSRFGFTGDATLNQPMIADADKQACQPGRMCLTIDPRLEPNRDQFELTALNPIKSTLAEPVSTFSVDVDTASYALARRHLNQGRLPPKASVRVEEMINYFKYDYRRPESATAPFEPQITVIASPWNPNTKLVHIGLKGYEIKAAERPRANIVLLVDVSGSMGPSDRLPLLKTAFRMMLDELKPDDTVAIVTYASGTAIALQPTRVANRAAIAGAIDQLQAGGGTYGAGGLQLAYQLAERNFDAKAVNRIILGTDGDWNIGITNRDELTAFIERKRATGIFLSILGVGMGNHNDALMQKLAQNGNGVAAYIDTLSEARKVLVDEISSSLFTIAKDVKIQIEFNPARVSEYRLIGYETRALKREDFNNDKVDAGEVGSGHSVTAIYEITPTGAPVAAMPELRYGTPPAIEALRVAPLPAAAAKDGEFGFFKLRYKLPNEETSRLLEMAVTAALDKGALANASDDIRFSIAVAGYGQLLRGQPHLGAMTYDDVIALANSARGADLFGLRGEFVNLARLAKAARP